MAASLVPNQNPSGVSVVHVKDTDESPVFRTFVFEGLTTREAAAAVGEYLDLEFNSSVEAHEGFTLRARAVVDLPKFAS
jgi:hypothetical protein